MDADIFDEYHFVSTVNGRDTFISNNGKKAIWATFGTDGKGFSTWNIGSIENLGTNVTDAYVVSGEDCPYTPVRNSGFRWKHRVLGSNPIQHHDAGKGLGVYQVECNVSGE